MGSEPKSRDIRQNQPRGDKVRTLNTPADPVDKGLPSNTEAERFVLGSILLDGCRFNETATLTTEDFTTERHINIFRRMQDLHHRGENIDRVTVAEELSRHNELWQDGISYLVSLDDGMPHIRHIESWVRILRGKTNLRRTIFALEKARDECFLETAPPLELLDAHLAQIATIRSGCGGALGRITRVEDLDPIFANRTPTEYLIEPELPAKAVVTLSGNSESGKTTLACAWARDLFRRGHAVLILDRDRNPRGRICDRLERLGITVDSNRFRVWDCEQREPVPQPNHPIIVSWVKRIIAETGKAPLVIGDSLVCFFEGDEDENSAVDMRRLYDRFKVLTALGAVVIVIHHNNRNGVARGSSDLEPVNDQGFAVTNRDRNGGRLLDVITLRPWKSRYALSADLIYHYAGGRMVREELPAPRESFNDKLVKLLRANPGILSEAFEKLAVGNGLKRAVARDFLRSGASLGTIRVSSQGRRKCHSWNDLTQMTP